MAQSYYKFKPYTPTKLKKKEVAGVDDVDKTIKSLEKQRENLNERLRAEGIDPETLGGEFDNRNLLEKAFNLPADQGLLMDFFEVINRPVEAVKGMLTAGSRGDNAITGFAEGLAGKQKMSGSEFTKQFLGIEAETKVGKFLLDVGTDIALDPLTYLPPGIIAKGLTKLSKIGSKTVTRKGAEVVEYFVENAADVVRRASNGDEAAKKLIYTQAQIDDMAKVTASGAGSAAENQGAKLLNDYLKQEGLEDFADDFIAVQRGGSKKGKRFLKDIELYYRTSDDQWVRTGVIEVKDMTSSSGAFAFKSTVNPSDLKPGGVVSGYFDAVEELDFIKNIDDIDPKNLTAAQKKTYKARKALKTLRQDIIDGKLSIEDARKVFDNLDEADKLELDKIANNIFYDDLAKSGVTHISIKTKEYGTVLLSVDDAKKLVKVGRSTFIVDSQGGMTKRVLNKMLDAVGITTRRGETFTKAGKGRLKTAKSLIQGKELEASSRGMFITGVGEDEALTILDKIKDQTITDGDRVFSVSDALYDKNTKTLFISGSNVNRKKSLLKSQLDLAENVTPEMIEAADKSKSFLGDFVTQRKTGQFETITETLTLAGRARKGEFGETIQTVANAYKKFEIKFKLTFNLTAGFDAKTKALLMRAQGADMFDLERRSGVLASIKEELIKIDPDAGELLGELIEADAKIVNGKIIKLRREVGTADFADYMYNAIVRGDGDRIAIPAFANQAAETDFLNGLNKLYRDATGSTDVMFTVRKGKSGSQVLAFAGDASEMKDFAKYIADPANIRNINPYLSFGEKALSKKAKAFLRNNSEQITKYKKLSDELLDDLVNVAGFKNMPVELQKQIGYMRHTMTKGAMEGMRQQFPGVLSIYTKKGTQTLGKRNIMGSVQEINAVLRDFYNISEDFFDPNAFNAMEDFIKQVSRKMDQKQVLDIILANKGVDGSDLFKVVDNTQEVKAAMSPYDVMIKDFREDFSTLYENLSPEAQKAFDDFLLKNGYDAGKAIQLNKSAFNVLKGVEKAYFDVPELVKIYDKFLTNWKGLTLITPGFHMRNLFGNMFNSYAVGMDVVAQGKYLGVAMQELDTFQKVGKKLAQGLDVTGAERKIYDTVKGYFEQGVSQTHRGIRDLETVMEASAKGAAKPGTLKNTYNNVIRFNFNVAEKMDDVQRYALYRWSLDKTGDGIKAANTVAEALFDYSHLTPFEKSYMKRLFPFYTFMKNNFVFQMKNIFINPKQYARLGRAYKYASEDLAGYSLDDLPDYATENMWIPLPWTVDKNDKDAVAFLKATLPASDFTELVENPFKKGVTSITAPIKLLIEFGAGKDLFTGQPLEAFPGQKSAMPEGTGVLSGLRDRRGNLTISQSPIFIKIMNDLGLRAPINIASAGLDVVDTLAGYQGGVENLGDFLQRAGIAGVSEMDRLKLSKLYQDLEKLRELKKFYEQETGNQLPVLPRG